MATMIEGKSEEDKLSLCPSPCYADPALAMVVCHDAPMGRAGTASLYHVCILDRGLETCPDWILELGQMAGSRSNKQSRII